LIDRIVNEEILQCSPILSPSQSEKSENLTTQAVGRFLDKRDTSQPRDMVHATSVRSENRFERRGDVWFISYGDENALIPAAHIGLEYIAMLLREPFRSIEALRMEALSSSTGSPIQSSAQTDQDAPVDEFDSHYERSDAKAIQQYKGRALVLNEAIRDARDRGDDKRTEQLIAELEAI